LENHTIFDQRADDGKSVTKPAFYFLLWDASSAACADSGEY